MPTPETTKKYSIYFPFLDSIPSEYKRSAWGSASWLTRAFPELSMAEAEELWKEWCNVV